MPLHGTWQVTGGGPDIPVVPGIAAVMAVAIAGWLATILLILAVIFAVLAVLLVGAAVWMRRRYPDHSEQVARDLASFRAEVTAPKVAPAVVNHYHLHVAPGASAEGVNWALPLRDAVTEKEN
jgi:membrane protein implicated in regulation of membrane protease activity